MITNNTNTNDTNINNSLQSTTSTALVLRLCYNRYNNCNEFKTLDFRMTYKLQDTN